jgi:hypothetical protein
MKPNTFSKGVKVVLKSEKLPFSMKKTKNSKEIFSGISSSEKKLEKFLRILEKKFKEVIWYIGTDYFKDEIAERFMFAKSGFLEISLSYPAEIKAFFPNKKKAEKFEKSLKKVFEYYKINTGKDKIVVE